MLQISKFLRLSSVDRRLAFEAVIFLGLARFAVVVLPFRWVASVLGERNTTFDAAGTNGETESPASSPVRRVAWAIQRTGLYTPWRSNCLAKAIAGHFMLRRRQINSTIYFGVAKEVRGEFEAHAWLSSDGVILNDTSDLERYAIVAAFTD